MPNLRLCSTFLLAAILGGCHQAPAPPEAPPAQPAQSDAPKTNFPPGPAAQTGTTVGSRVRQLRTEVTSLNYRVDEHIEKLIGIRQERQAFASAYYSQVGEISARLQTGTTPSNPLLTAKWAEARQSLDKLEDNLSRVMALSNEMAIDGQTGAYLDDSTRAAFFMPGAIDEDHYQLRDLQAQVAASQAEISNELTDVTSEINRQSAALGIERNNMVTLAESVRVGELLGHSLANREPYYDTSRVPALPGTAPASARPARAAAAAPTGPRAAVTHHPVVQHVRKPRKVPAPSPTAPVMPAASPIPLSPALQRSMAAPAMRRPEIKTSATDTAPLLMVIRFDRFTERYQEALYFAIRQALDAQPAAKFRVVGMTPEASVPAGTAQRVNAVRLHVKDVERALLSFGLSANRVSTAAEATPRASAEEVRVYRD